MCVGRPPSRRMNWRQLAAPSHLAHQRWHYRIRHLCREPVALGKGRYPLGTTFAERNPTLNKVLSAQLGRQRALCREPQSTLSGKMCREPHMALGKAATRGHVVKPSPTSLSRAIRQALDKESPCASWLSAQPRSRMDRVSCGPHVCAKSY
jgi:hypothetical protein